MCLVYLLHPELSLGQIDHPNIKQYPFAIYAAQCWYTHYIHALDEESQEAPARLKTLVLRLFIHETLAFNTWRGLQGPYDPKDTFLLPENIELEDEVFLSDTIERAKIACHLGLEFAFNELLTAASTIPEPTPHATKDKATILVNALCIAAYRGHGHMAEALITNGADMNSIYKGGLDEEYWSWLGTPLHAASAAGREKVFFDITRSRC